MNVQPLPATPRGTLGSARFRALRSGLGLPLVLVAILALSALPERGPGPVSAARIQEEPTPIIEPLPKPEPIYLPLTVRVYKASAPDPLDSERMGYLTGMSAAGRQACQPGVYALLDKPEGRPDAKALAVLYSAAHGPNLDFFVGEAVKVKGALLQSPTQCRIFTVWLMEVERIERIELPPLH